MELSGAIFVPIHDVCLCTLNTFTKGEKNDSRIISDLSFPEGDLVNAGVPKDSYLGLMVDVLYPSIVEMYRKIRKKGSKCLLYKLDLSRAYRQIPVDPGDMHFMGSA